MKNLQLTRQRRQLRIRSRIKSNVTRPRLSVFRSNRRIYAQIIDDDKGKTLVAASDQEIKQAGLTKTERAKLVGELVAERAKLKKIKQVVFDRGRFKFHGRIKSLAAGARSKELQF